MIYLIRHGKAQSYADSDFNRRLTPEGKAELEENFKNFKESFKSENFKVYSSPYLRAVETAEIFARIFNCDFDILNDLAMNKDYDKVVNALDDKEDYILIGHEPYISDAIYKLTGSMLKVKKGSIHRVR
ncbi:SixA phosphatase family protein [Peptoniphilus catoniae]|uniref:SixA phosphatase family protein n=1 Tax=Peptoniphilus catoniae TaxID=1660341 RepID=UPI0010FE9ECE|nr:histidine phosphatase family protein [Peptoniphilus catoniae]